MKGHKYRITVDYVEDVRGNPIEDQTLTFMAANHDEILKIVERIRQSEQFDAEEAVSFAIGLKLFSEVMIKNRDHVLFTEFRPHFMDFMKHLKATVSASQTAESAQSATV
ncbi:DUF3861 domain-containing protein [Orrella sp. 11846]|uniref:DUF3861 domain-containing protein n=1 Tax=Orrella sp. 11846 TaxID=3409913 RepID=UPI003B5B80DD